MWDSWHRMMIATGIYGGGLPQQEQLSAQPNLQQKRFYGDRLTINRIIPSLLMLQATTDRWSQQTDFSIREDTNQRS